MEFASGAFIRRICESVGNTLTIVLSALVVGIPIGSVIGLAIGMGGQSFDGGYVLLNSFRSVPVTVLLPVFLAAFGLNGFLIPLLAVPVIAIMGANMTRAVRESTLNRRQLLELFEFGRLAYVRHVVPWDAADALFATLRTVIPLTFSIEVAVDYFLNFNQGIGTVISHGYQYPNQEAAMFAAIFVAAVVGISSIALVDISASRMLQWKRGI